MAEAVQGARSEARVHPADKRGIIPGIWHFFMRLLGIVLFSAFISVVVEWIGMAFFYEDQGYTHAKGLFQSEIGYLNEGITSGAHQLQGQVMAVEWVTRTIQFLFYDSGFVGWIQTTYTVDAGDNAVSAYFKGVMAKLYDYIIASMYILMMVIVRFAILVLSSPVFLLFGIVGLIDGLMKRDLRKFTGGHESSFMYHLAKGFAMPFLIFGWVIYLAMPFSVHPNFIIIPFAVLFGFSIFLTASKFKKYL